MIRRDITSQCWRRLYNSSIHHHFSTLSSDQNLISLLQSCHQIRQTARIHCLMVKTGLDRIPFPLSKLLAQVSTQDINYADSIFNQIKSPNLYMFNTMLRAHSISPDPGNSLLLFNRMRAENHSFDFDQFTFISVLKSCSSLVEIRAGLGVHTDVLKSGFDSVLNVMNALLHFYCVCGMIKDARQVFDELRLRKDVVSWNTLMGGYLCVKEYSLVWDFFKLFCRDSFGVGVGVGVSVTTLLNVVSAVGHLLNESLGETIHVLCFKLGFLSNLNVVAALISMYGKHGRVQSARRIFDEIDDKRDVVLWNSLIDGYARTGLLEEAMELLSLMKDRGIRPNSSTVAGLLSACSASGALGIGEYVHGYVEEEQLPLDAVLSTAIVDMYAKSGLLDKAVNVFNRLEFKDVKSWTAMISGCGVHGRADHAVTLFRRMEEEGVVPNEVTFLTVMNACSHGGLMREGLSCFRKMANVYQLRPKIEHYGCMIDLLGRAGFLEEAYELIKGLPVERDATALRALLGACKVYGNVKLAEHVKEQLEGIHENHTADSLSLAGAYVAAGMVADQSYEVETARKGAGYSKIDLPF
ncbi:pentatricopeptide repeat-containing protein At1g26900, mitochondrial-like [Salvia hispanica]|uniref:pentatricopeptide repeat-containing protein At1g26900, mitochondrial-like n=1 Tax=Salvia hispanica TaxID=49212 RepID=UPI0020097D85|nr:pentatricopeptide repeat-containing protein At1g26900, mitochondrial-like [Salvia hispanica]